MSVSIGTLLNLQRLWMTILGTTTGFSLPDWAPAPAGRPAARPSPRVRRGERGDGPLAAGQHHPSRPQPARRRAGQATERVHVECLGGASGDSPQGAGTESEGLRRGGRRCGGRRCGRGRCGRGRCSSRRLGSHTVLLNDPQNHSCVRAPPEIHSAGQRRQQKGHTPSTPSTRPTQAGRLVRVRVTWRPRILHREE